MLIAEFFPSQTLGENCQSIGMVEPIIEYSLKKIHILVKKSRRFTCTDLEKYLLEVKQKAHCKTIFIA